MTALLSACYVTTVLSLYTQLRPSLFCCYYGSTALCWALAAFSVSYLYIVGMSPWTGDQPVARPLPTHGTT
jgi:hypothetical protein